MKKITFIALSFVGLLALASCSTNQATDSVAESTQAALSEAEKEQEVKTIKLDQEFKVFTTESLELEAGKPYSFEVSNHAGRQAAFVLAPKPAEGASFEDIQPTIIGDAMLNEVLEDGQTGTSKAPVTLEAGEYVYFCPMNETPQYSITVK